jgi:hypothetical protein
MIVMMCRSVLLTVALISLATTAEAQGFADLCRATTAPLLETSGRQLTLDGRPTFIVLVSYFDAMRASSEALQRDFAFLKSKGVRGVRLFPLWIAEGQQAEATLLDGRGRIRNDERWRHFEGILKTAAACGLVVDVTFNREMIVLRGAPMSLSQYQSGIVDVVGRLKASGAHTHVFIDLQNERNRGIPGMDYSVEEIRTLRDALKKADPERLVMCSTLGGIKETIELVTDARLDIAAFHEDQKRAWYRETPGVVEALGKTGKPVYLQEMGRAPDRGVQCEIRTGAPNAFTEAVRTAKKAGAAAWTFHTDAGFRLDREQFQEQVRGCAHEREFLDALPRSLE